MATLETYAASFVDPSALARVEGGERLAVIFDALQHQGSLKRAAYEHMNALVELEMCAELWTLWGALGAGSASPDGLDAQSGEVRTRFCQALDIAASRIRARLPEAEDDEEALSLLAALAGVHRAPAAQALLENLDQGGSDAPCPRCGAGVIVSRRGRELELHHGDETTLARAKDGARADGIGAMLVDAAERTPRNKLRAALRTLFAPVTCPRCKRDYSLVDDARATTLSSLRRVESPSADAAIVEMPAPLRERTIARLVDIGRRKSEDVVRLPGVGTITVQLGAIWPPGPMSAVRPGDLPKKALLGFTADKALEDLLNRRDVIAPVPSDDPELDAFAARALAAFQDANEVDVPGFLRLTVEERPARRGATIDDDPTIVPRRYFVRRTLGRELEERLATLSTPGRLPNPR